MNRLGSTLLLILLLGCYHPGVSYFDDKNQEPTQKMTEITLIRSGGVDGPEDTLTLRSDKSAVYVGKTNVERIGGYTGSVSEYGFHDNFPLLAEQYAALRGQPLSTGKPSGERVVAVTIRVTWDGKPEEIVDLCPGIDRRWWSLEMSCRGVAADIAWKSDKPKKP